MFIDQVENFFSIESLFFFQLKKKKGKHFYPAFFIFLLIPDQ